jgi:hypothetical protein
MDRRAFIGSVAAELVAAPFAGRTEAEDAGGRISESDLADRLGALGLNHGHAKHQR